LDYVSGETSPVPIKPAREKKSKGIVGLKRKNSVGATDANGVKSGKRSGLVRRDSILGKEKKVASGSNSQDHSAVVIEEKKTEPKTKTKPRSNSFSRNSSSVGETKRRTSGGLVRRLSVGGNANHHVKAVDAPKDFEAQSVNDVAREFTEEVISLFPDLRDEFIAKELGSKEGKLRLKASLDPINKLEMEFRSKMAALEDNATLIQIAQIFYNMHNMLGLYIVTPILCQKLSFNSQTKWFDSNDVSRVYIDFLTHTLSIYRDQKLISKEENKFLTSKQYFLPNFSAIYNHLQTTNTNLNAMAENKSIAQKLSKEQLFNYCDSFNFKKPLTQTPTDLERKCGNAEIEDMLYLGEPKPEPPSMKVSNATANGRHNKSVGGLMTPRKRSKKTPHDYQGNANPYKYEDAL
jgi:hypothetical protein